MSGKCYKVITKAYMKKSKRPSAISINNLRTTRFISKFLHQGPVILVSTFGVHYSPADFTVVLQTSDTPTKEWSRLAST